MYFDTRVGELLVGSAAIEERLPHSSPGDIVALVELLTSHHFPYGSEHFPNKDAASWSREDTILAGRWLLNLVVDGTENSPQTLTMEHMERAYLLGLGPRLRHNKYFKNIAAYREEIGAPEGFKRDIYSCWTTQDFVKYARGLSNRLGRKPRTKDYNAANGPKQDVIQKRFGGNGPLNELIGYPDYRRWDNDDYIQWGVRVLCANTDKTFTKKLLNELSRQEKGPSEMPIFRRFGSWTIYKQQVLEEHLRLETENLLLHQQKTAYYENFIKKEGLPMDYQSLKGEELIHFGAKYRLLCYVLRAHPQKNEVAFRVAQEPSNMLLRKVRNIADIKAAEFEMAAYELGVYDDIWPMTELDEALKVA